mgnify:CR=1 FL=1
MLFVLLENQELILGPLPRSPRFCTYPNWKRFCGTAVSNNETHVVKDVHQFPGHIACDANSNSEIVIPIHKDNEIIGVLDIDAPIKSRFNEEDRIELEKVVSIIENQIK